MDELLDRAPCGFVSVADDGRVLAVNATLLERLGRAREDVVGHHVEALFTVATRIFYQTHFFPLVRMHGRAQEVFLLLRGASGEEVGALCNAARRERGGQHVTDCVLMEVRERRKFEDALLEAKRAAEQARRAADVANAQLQEQAVELELQHTQLQEQAAEMEALNDELAEVNEVLRRRGEELERERQVAEEANRAKSAFLAVMSHELRTPLNAIGGYAQLLEMGVHGPVTEAQLVAIARIVRSQRHLLRLINDILNLAKIEAGRVEYFLEPVPLVELVEGVTPLVEPQMTAKGLRFTASADASIVATADREKLQQILLNLLTNATKFTPASGSIRIEAESGGPVARLRVRDSGIGIPPEMLGRVFEPFVQVDASHTRPSEGTGLGLAISRDLARGMGGDLTVESELGAGSTFTLTLPAAAQSPPDAPTAAAGILERA